jgi:uncharacterized protein YajQ (UPF0234 family)
MATDNGIHEQINHLIAREHELRESLAAGEINAAEEQSLLHDLEVQLDQAWDLLRQRQAKRDAGEDPSAAHVRPASEVEGYLG